MTIGVLGAGISGLSFARLAGKDYEVEVLERKSVPGGIARTKTVEGITYHVTGGHCFNSKNKEVMDFVFTQILPKENWHQIIRRADIQFKGHHVSYPIEYAIQQIHAFDPALAIRITRDFLNANDDGSYANLEDWFRKKFGDALAEEYLIPYNTKIWNREPEEMSPDWVAGKLPIPDKESFFRGLIGKGNDTMPHSTFFYPNTNNQNTFIEALAKDVSVVYNYEVKQIRRDEAKQKWVVNEEKEYDILISTLPLNIIPFLVNDAPQEVLEAASKLKYNKVTTMLWETAGTDQTWTYVPSNENFFHRYIHIGSFFTPKKNYTITEVVGEKTYDEMVANGRQDKFLLRPVDYYVSEHAYVVFDQNYGMATKVVKDYLSDIGLHTLGRFGEWQYYNMDICIEKSLALFASLQKQSVHEH